MTTLEDDLVLYPHCKHCCWDNEHHVAIHTTPCWSGCAGATPIGAP